MTRETKNISSKNEKVSECNSETTASPKLSPEARRRFIKASIVGVPVILTLKSRAAWGGNGGGMDSIMQSIHAGSSAHPNFHPGGKS